MAISAAQVSLGGLLLLLVAPLGALPDEVPGVEAWLSILALGALGTGVAYVLNFNVVRAAGAQTASMVTYLVPVFAVVFGVTILGRAAELARAGRRRADHRRGRARAAAAGPEQPSTL